jgi:N-acyl-D-aspartate/D-glutamate deacylase
VDLAVKGDFQLILMTGAGDAFSVGGEEVQYRMSALLPDAAGFRDRDVLNEGAAADVVVYDLDDFVLNLNGWRDRAPLPGGEGAVFRRTKGSRWIMANGLQPLARAQLH